jgi:type IX secretion system PorP/SprF family membrane protein
MKRLYIHILLCLPLSIIAQIQPIFTVYREQTATLNPAMPSTNYIVSDFSNTISATYRYQWIGVDGAPITQVLNWENMIDDNNILIGAHILNDRTGNIGNTSAYARFAYKLVMSDVDKRFLSIGMNVGGRRFYENLGEFTTQQGTVIPNRNFFKPDVSFGAFYNEGNRFYVGASAFQLLGDTRLPPHIYGTAGLFIDAPFFGNDAAYLEPTVWFRYVPTYKTMQADINLRAKVSQTFWAGAGYNTSAKALNVELGSVLGDAIGLNNGFLRIGLGYWISVGKVQSLGQTGEVIVSYAWGN